MMRYDLGINRIIRKGHFVKGAVISALCAIAIAMSVAPAEAQFAEAQSEKAQSEIPQIDIGALGAQSTMAEQGAICASFAALMENQLLINQNLGNLWSERRKFSGAVIRRAVELSNLPSPSSDSIDALINDYREWLILNLSSKDPNISLIDYQSDVQNMIKTNCKSLYQQADKAIIKRFPDLAYLIDESIIATVQQDAKKDAEKDDKIDDKQLSALMAKNNELNVQIIALRAELNALKVKNKKAQKQEQEPQTAQLTAPTPRPDAPQRPKEKPAIKPAVKQAEPTKARKRFFAQLGSFSSEESAQVAMTDFNEKYPQLFNDIALQIRPHEFASRKIFYRVRTNDADRTIITKICDRLWDARMGCLIKTNID